MKVYVSLLYLLFFLTQSTLSVSIRKARERYKIEHGFYPEARYHQTYPTVQKDRVVKEAHTSRPYSSAVDFVPNQSSRDQYNAEDDIINEPKASSAIISRFHNVASTTHAGDDEPHTLYTTVLGKGKEAASTLDKVSFDPISNAPAKDGMVIALDINQDPINPSRRASTKLPTKGTRPYLRGQNRLEFKKEWNRLGLGTHLSSTELANQVALMRVPGMTERAIGKLASRILSTYSSDADYINRFNMRKVRLSRFAFEVRKEMKSNAGYEILTKEQDQVAIREAIQRLYLEQHSRNYGESKTAKARKVRADKKMQEVANFMQQYLKKKHMDLSTISPDQLEVESRNVSMNKMPPKTFTDYLFRYLKEKKNVSETVLDKLRYKRIVWRASVNGVHQTRKRRAERQPNRLE